MKKLLVICTLLTACTANLKNDRSSENEQVVRAMFDAFNQNDWVKMAGYYADSALYLDPSFGIDYMKRSRAETAAKYKEMQAIFPDIHDEIVGFYAIEDKVIVEFISTGTAPDSSSFKLPIVSVLTLKNRLIVKDATYYDNSH